MFGLSFVEIAIVAILALLLLGPDQLPSAAKTLGKGLRELRKATDDLKGTFTSEMSKLEREVDLAQVDGPKPLALDVPVIAPAPTATTNAAPAEAGAAATGPAAPPEAPSVAPAPRRSSLGAPPTVRLEPAPLDPGAARAAARSAARAQAPVAAAAPSGPAVSAAPPEVPAPEAAAPGPAADHLTEAA
jgi:sec-independent protein translocase protein TatB